MGRYQSFGHLFAMAGGTGFRLDRHPTMARHPSTPMDEADLGRHLARQTERRVGLVDFVAMKRGEADARLDAARAEGMEIVSLDVLDHETLIEAGRLIWERGGVPAFALGSQGVEAALVAYWREAGLLATDAAPPPPGPVARIACVSGSVSPVTAGQIAHALENGFAGIRLDARLVVDPVAWERRPVGPRKTPSPRSGKGAIPSSTALPGPTTRPSRPSRMRSAPRAFPRSRSTGGSAPDWGGSCATRSSQPSSPAR